MPDQPSLLPARPTIPARDWLVMTAACRDKDEVRRVTAAYKLGFGAGQGSICAAVNQAMLQAIHTPQRPDEGE